MGSPSYEAGRDENEGPVHQVTIGKPLAVGKYEVTMGEYGHFVETTGYKGESGCSVWMGEKWEGESERSWRDPGFRQTERAPVVCVSWRDAHAYAEWLSRQTDKPYRLLSEAEWEYVARAGTKTARYWGEREVEQCRYANGADSRKDFKWRMGHPTQDSGEDGHREHQSHHARPPLCGPLPLDAILWAPDLLSPERKEGAPGNESTL